VPDKSDYRTNQAITLKTPATGSTCEMEMLPQSQTVYRGLLLQTKFIISKSAQNLFTQDEMHRRSTLRERHR
jgi:hypothetical protein